MHDADRGIISLDYQSDLGLGNQHRVCVVQHRIDWVCSASVVATTIASETDTVTEGDSGQSVAVTFGFLFGRLTSLSCA
jgi:hypothetical protein